MTKLKTKQRNLNYLSSLFLLIGFLTFGAFTQVHATTTSLLGVKQSTTITGYIVSEDDKTPLPGVNVIIKGTTSGVTTDFDGKYSITVPSQNTILVFSFVGYKTQEITVGSKTSIDVFLAVSAESLDEVVVVGYGTRKKETLTGAIETVSAEVFTGQAVASPGLALQGRTPGLVVTRNSSRPGDEDLDFLIRGATSINGISPLIVIDGVPALNNDSFNNMNANDIENISVLKGGSASVYGSRAAGGVILVTTKKGKGDVKVDIGVISRIGTIGIRPPSPTMSEYGQLYLAAVDEDLASGKPPRYFFWNDRETVERIASGEEGYYDLPINGNIWLGEGNRFDEMFGNSNSQQYTLGISGGTEKSDFRVSASFDNNIGGLKVTEDSSKRSNFLINYNTEITSKFRVNTNVTYFRNNFSGPTAGLDREAATWDAPLFPTYTADGLYYSQFGGVNIPGDRNAVAQVKDGGRETKTLEQFKIFAQAIYDITDYLNVSGSYSYSKQNSIWQQYAVSVPLYSWQGDFASNINSTTYISEGTGPDTNDGIINYNNYRAALNYDDTYGDHHISGMVALEAEKYERKELYAKREGFVDYGVYDINLGATDLNVTNSGGGTEWGFYGYIARINYDYKSKYFLELQGRYDGSSKFAEGSKWSPYGSVSAGWILSAEDFLKDSNFVSFLKLRGGYGELGSTAGIGDFGYLSTVGFGSTAFGQTSAALQQTSRASSLFSSTTTWERIATSEIGVDFRLLDNKLFGSLDLYNKKNIGMLVKGIVPNVLGTSSPYTNIGDMESKGWEAMLGWKNQFGEWDVAVSANMSNATNEITKYDGAQSIVENLNEASAGENIVGRPINSFYLWETNGYFDSQAEVDAYYANLTPGGILPSQSSNDALRPGDMIVVDSNGDGKLDNDDLTYKGDNAVHYAFGFNLEVKWRNFDLGAFFQGALKNQIYRTGYFAQPFQAEWQNQSNAWLGRTWTEDNRDAEFPRLSTQRGISKWNYRSKDHILQNNRYLRLKSLIVGYNIPGIKAGEKVLNTRVYFSGNDLWETTTVKDGYDPESKASSNSATYPFMRTWALGITLSI